MLFSFAAAILGGFGRLGGVVVGALLIGLSTQWLAGYLEPNLVDLYPFVIMLAAIALRPQGLFGSEVGSRV
jgi:branched-chain amino acid transport system permease protein